MRDMFSQPCSPVALRVDTCCHPHEIPVSALFAVECFFVESLRALGGAEGCAGGGLWQIREPSGLTTGEPRGGQCGCGGVFEEAGVHGGWRERTE